MRLTTRWWVALTLGVASTGAAADALDINLHSTAMRLTYAHHEPQNLEIDVGHFFTEEDVTVTHVGLHVQGENWSKKGTFDIGLGGRLVHVRDDPFSATALALGGRVRFSPVHRLGIGGSLYHAPNITAWPDADGYTEGSVHVDYQLLTNAYVYVAYRNITVNVTDVKKDAEIDDDINVGMRLVF